MSRSLCTEVDDRRLNGRPVGRRGVLLALLLAPLAACGKKGPLELPPPEPFDEGGGDDLEEPQTYGDPMTFPEPGEDEESAE